MALSTLELRWWLTLTSWEDTVKVKNDCVLVDGSRWLAGAVLIVLCVGLLAVQLAVASSMPRIATCYCYSDASFAYNAEQTSLTEAPWKEGIDPVYVMNFHTGEVRYFDVHRWVDSDYSPQGASTTQRTHMMQGYFQAEAVPGAGDSNVISAMLDARSAVNTFVSELSGSISIDELGELGINSAVGLVGPKDSPAGLRRNALRNSLNNYYANRWSTITFGLYDLAMRIAGRFLSESMVQYGSITITFPDQSTIQVRVEEVLDGIDGSDIALILEVRTETAQGPGLPSVPQSPGQFDGFTYVGNDLTVADLIKLAQRYGIPITGPGGDKFECKIEGNAIKCRVSGK